MRSSSFRGLRALRALIAPSLALASACAGSTAAKSGDDVTMATSSLSRDTAPAVPGDDADTLRKDNTAFAVDLYHALTAAPPNGAANVFFSPHSISEALAMAYAGARGNTATQMATALHFTLASDSVPPSADPRQPGGGVFNRLDKAFDALDLALRARNNDTTALQIVDSLWGAPDLVFEPAFLDTLAVSYGSGVRLTNFASDPDASRTRINGWVGDETNDKIPTLLPPGSITTDTRLVLVNAVHFKSTWATPFLDGATGDATFHGSGGDATVSLMHLTSSLAYAAGAGYHAVSLPYDSGLTLTAIVPDDFPSFERTLDVATLDAVQKSLEPTELRLGFPKLKIDGASFSLADTLKARGMVDAFDGARADFSGITSHERIKIADVIHEAFIDIDERGTEAAAATAVLFADAGAMIEVTPPVAFDVDKPFVFFVRDEATGAILFLGRYVGG